MSKNKYQAFSKKQTKVNEISNFANANSGNKSYSIKDANNKNLELKDTPNSSKFKKLSLNSTSSIKIESPILNVVNSPKIKSKNMSNLNTGRNKTNNHSEINTPLPEKENNCKGDYLPLSIYQILISQDIEEKRKNNLGKVSSLQESNILKSMEKMNVATRNIRNDFKKELTSQSTNKTNQSKSSKDNNSIFKKIPTNNPKNSNIVKYIQNKLDSNKIKIQRKNNK